ncbi:response regulator [Opitutus sp. ER46]|uniref:response regulator n=1 Tax=Opitutus sp. ER46 TaxID=2161864 RepID=UPI001304D389|nr:response regulator [Opitutus sp. ER46]
MIPNSTQAHPPEARTHTVVVADHIVADASILRSWLEQMGVSPICVASGREAIRLIRQQPIDLVITEVIMPNGDGLEVILELKKQQPGAPVIAMSGGGRYLPAADCLRVAKGLGAHEIMMKPLRHADFLRAARQLLPALAEAAISQVQP